MVWGGCPETGILTRFTPVVSISLWGLSPLCEIGISGGSVYQMTTSKILARGEGICRRANELAHLRGTAASLLCVEPTRPEPHARWCGGVPGNGQAYPISLAYSARVG